MGSGRREQGKGGEKGLRIVGEGRWEAKDMAKNVGREGT